MANGVKAQKHFLTNWLLHTEIRNWFKLDDDGEGPRALHEKRMEAAQKITEVFQAGINPLKKSQHR